MSKIARTLTTGVGTLAAPVARASGSPSQPGPEGKSPEQQAIEHYNNGIAGRDQAWKLEKKLGEATEDNEMEQWIEQRASTVSDTVGHAMPRHGDRW